MEHKEGGLYDSPVSTTASVQARVPLLPQRAHRGVWASPPFCLASAHSELVGETSKCPHGSRQLAS